MIEDEAHTDRLVVADCDPMAVQKMVEFCETNAIADFGGFEVELYKIASTYQIAELMVWFSGTVRVY